MSAPSYAAFHARVPRGSLDIALRNDAAAAQRFRATAFGDPTVFADMSDLEVACAYERGPSELHDAMYCELHQRGLTPWQIAQAPALDASTEVAL